MTIWNKYSNMKNKATSNENRGQQFKSKFKNLELIVLYVSNGSRVYQLQQRARYDSWATINPQHSSLWCSKKTCILITPFCAQIPAFIAPPQRHWRERGFYSVMNKWHLQLHLQAFCINVVLIIFHLLQNSIRNCTLCCMDSRYFSSTTVTSVRHILRGLVLFVLRLWLLTHTSKMLVVHHYQY